MAAIFETILTWGHPNSLGRTVEVAQLVLDEPERITELFRTFDSADERWEKAIEGSCFRKRRLRSWRRW